MTLRAMTIGAACATGEMAASWDMQPGTPPSPEDSPVLALLFERRSDLDPAVVELLLTLRAAAPAYIEADDFAQRIGLRSRFALVRHLRKLRLPPFRDLQAHIRVLAMKVESERKNVSLSKLAWQNGGDPASWLRLVRRVTGHPWSAVSRRDTLWLACKVGVLLWGGNDLLG